MNARISPEVIGELAIYSSKPLNLLPFKLPDETFGSQIGRYHVSSGNTTTRRTYQDMFGCGPFSLTAPSPRGLEALADRLSGGLQDNRQNLLLNLTLFPLFRIFAAATHEFLPRKIDEGRRVQRLIGAVSQTFLCLDCLAADYEDTGHRYIHRSHQIPGVGACWRHGTTLLFKCPCCEHPFEKPVPHDLVLTPWEPCSACSMPIWEVSATLQQKAGDEEYGFAKFSHDMLQHPSKEVSSAVLTVTYRMAAKEQGFAQGPKGTRLDRGAMTESFVARYGTELLGKIDPVIRTDRASGWFQILTASSTFESPLQRHLLFAHHFFNTAENFWHYIAAAETLSLGLVKKSTVRKSGPQTSVTSRAIKVEEQISEAEQSIRAFRDLYPDATIDRFWKEKRSVMQRFLNEAPIRFHALREELAAGGKTTKSETLQVDSSEDAALAVRVERAAQQLYLETGCPVKVSRNRILKAIGKKCGLPPAHTYPLARKVLDEVAETTWHFWARKFLWAKARLPQSSSASSVILACRSSWECGLVLNNYFDGLAVPTADSPGALMQTLSVLGIGTRWEGPCPNRLMTAGGRGYIPKRHENLMS